MAILRRTKTTGPNKRVKTVPLHIPLGVSISGVDWLTAGYDLWAEVGPRGRDYFLPRPAEDLQGFRSGPASSSDMAALLCRAMQELQAPSGGRILSEQLAMVWTGHSERATLPSWLAAQGAPKEDRYTVGRWTPKDSDNL